MKKIGIVTFHRAINFGGVLQSYALQKKLKDYGLDVEEIDYYSNDVYKIYNYFYVGKFNIIKTPIKIALNFGFFIKNIRIKKKFNKFREKYIQTSDFLSSKEKVINYINRYDYIISGSDQVWNKDITLNDYDFYDLSLFNTNNKISYAASVGKDDISEQEKAYYKNLIKGYNSVSVRESSLQNTLGEEVSHVMDPVFLLEKEEWYKIKSSAYEKEKYIFIFSLQQNSNINQIVDSLNNDYKIIYYSKIPMFKKNVKCVYDISPEDFLSLVFNAEMVVTNSFHCLAFSLIFNKKFISVLHKDKSSRQVDLLKKIGLTNRIYSNNISYLLENDIDYSKVEKVLKSEIKKSIKFIEESLKISNIELNNVTITKKEKCFGCGACINICPVKAIVMKEDEKGFNYPQIDESKCIHCGACVKACPYNNLTINSDLKKHFYAVKIKDDNIRKISTSGGAFYGMASEIINNNGVVYGALYNKNLAVVHNRITKIEDITKMMGSKYVQSSTENIFGNVKKDVEAGKKVLFTGTPCQIAAIKSFLKKDYSNLILCDIICHGVPSPKTFKDHLSYIEEKRKKNIKNYLFRIKDNGWHSTNHLEKIVYEDESIDSSSILSQSFKYFFYSCKTFRDSCFECPFSNVEHRLSDLTIGDFWGIEKNYPSFDDDLGISLCIIHNKKGMKFFDGIKNKYHIIETEKDKSLQENLIKPTDRPENIEQFWKEYNEKGYDYVLKKYTPYGFKNSIIYSIKKLIKKIINRK